MRMSRIGSGRSARTGTDIGVYSDRPAAGRLDGMTARPRLTVTTDRTLSRPSTIARKAD